MRRGTGCPGWVASAAIAAALAIAPDLAAQEAVWTLGGTLTQRGYGAGVEGTAGAEYSYGSVTTLETTLSVSGRALRAEFSGEAAILAGQAAEAFASFASANLIPEDTLYSPATLSDAETILAARVRTAYVKWNAQAFSLTVGRQIVNYGKGTAWSPVDLFTELDYSGLSLIRAGGDALRLTVPFGPLALFEAVGEPKADPGEGIYALRAAGLIFGAMDASIVAAWDGEAEAWKLGGDAKVDFAAFSLYADATCSIPRGGGAGVPRVAAGFDTSFGELILAGEYYYNGGGSAADPGFPGAHNAYASLTWKLADYHSLSVYGLWDVESEIFSVQTAWTYDMAQNGTLTAYIKAANGSFAEGGKLWTAQLGAQIMIRF